MQRKTAATIDQKAIRANYSLALSLAPMSKAVAVIKADAYGHGLLPVASALRDLAPMFGVATIDEALELREAGISNAILVLEGVTTGAACETAKAHDLVLMVHALEQVDMMTAASGSAWVKVDTGMHRLGINAADLADVLQRLQKGDVNVEAVCTHLACAEELDNTATTEQIAEFTRCTAGHELPLSIANSAAIIGWPDSLTEWVRPGIMVYGVSPIASDVEAVRSLRPAMTFASEIIAIREVPTGDSVGYGARWTADRPSLIATVAAGYADGYPRHASNGTPVYVGGELMPLVGSVSMDMITVDVTGLASLAGLAIGDPVELWGCNNPVSEVARCAGTISYELLAGVTSRVPRIYV
jgi:alanine racemase